MKQREKRQLITTFLLTVGILIIDQVIKISVKTGMYMHQSIRITDWFYLLFTENNGMAFGMELFPKWFLTSFRIVAVLVILFYILSLIRRGVHWGFLICMILIMAGAAGNIFDCLFYGMIFNDPPAPFHAELVAWGTGYAPLMTGRVVDMFYFPLVEWNWPNQLPFIGGSHFIFFSPIFNFADACISCGFIALLLFFRRTLTR